MNIRRFGIMLVAPLLAAVACLPWQTPSVEDLMARRRAVSGFHVVITNSTGDRLAQTVMLRDGLPARMKIEIPGGWLHYDTEQDEMISVVGGTAMRVPHETDPQPDQGVFSCLSPGKVRDLETANGLSYALVELPLRGSTMTLWIDTNTGLVHRAMVDEQTLQLSYERINQISPTELDIPAGLVVREGVDVSSLLGGNRH